MPEASPGSCSTARRATERMLFPVLLAAAIPTAAWLPARAVAAQPEDDRLLQARERMVRDDIAGGGVTDPRVLESMRLTPRHEFVPAAQRHLAYFDMALPIGESQTISAPFVVAYMTEKLEPRPTDRVLEIGTGSGYQAAVLSPLVGKVYSIEISRALGERAARTLARLGCRNVITRIGDGFLGWPEQAPFDRIIVTCSPENVPRPLVEQLAEGGRMIVPVGERFEQTLVLLTKRDGDLVREALVPSLFVPMTGTAEEGRRVLPDADHPSLSNGGFEDVMADGHVPTAWYYGRQMRVVESGDAREGTRYLHLENTQPGRPAQVFQGFAVDGRTVGRLKISLVVRGEDIREGLTADAAPALAVRFFDEHRGRSTQAGIGPWRGTFAWQRTEGTVVVPAWAREAILQIGMLGATGRLEADDVRITAVKR